jgi:serine/threonine protein kinase
MPADLQRVQSVFLAAVRHPDNAGRQVVLERECAGDGELRQQVESLLLAYDERDTHTGEGPAPSALMRPAETVFASTAPPITEGAEWDDTDSGGGSIGGSASCSVTEAGERGGTAPRGRPAVGSAALPITERVGGHIGPYKLLQKLGDGGMGTVYMAEQEAPVRRQVALKIIKPGMDSELVIARFEAERQALALMDHQNIARVLDAGTTDAGRPFFVMELVHGVPITEFCDKNQLTPRARIELYVLVCQAIQHAHQKGIIHRDIKPSNVLVTLYEGKPVPKVIDFGVAKAIDQRLTERTMFTLFGSIVGTPAYMSPEQAGFSALGVDTRSDIYSLGVLLYELLTGSTPLEQDTLIGAGYDEIIRRIRNEESAKPSTRVSSLKGKLPEIAARRQTEPDRLPRLYRGELDWIVMKALEKDRARRYETANGLARDLQRYLNGDTVEACPPSARYRLAKFARKYRVALAGASAFVALLVLGAALSIYQAIRATQAERTAVALAHRAREAEQQARSERDHAKAAETQAKAEEVKANQSAAEARSVLEFFDKNILAATRPQGQEGGLGRNVTIRQAVDAALAKIDGAFPSQPAVEASIREELGVTYHFLGEPSTAIGQLERAFVLRAAKLGPDDPATLTSQNHLALAYRDAGRWDQAIRLFERTLAAESVKLGAEHPDTLLTLNNLALACRDDRQWERAIALFERALAGRATKLGADHPDTLLTQQNLAMAHREAGRFDQAIPIFERTLTAQSAKLGPDHPFTLLTKNNLAPAYLAAGQTDRAIALLEQTLAARKAKLGADHPSTFSSQNNLALAYQASGHLDQSIPLFEQTLAGLEAKLGKDHPRTMMTQHDLAIALRVRGDLSRAEAMLNDVLARRQKRLGAAHPDVATSLIAVGETLIKDRKWADAEPILRQGLEILQGKGSDEWSKATAQALIGTSLLGQKRYDEAEPLLLSSYQSMTTPALKIPAPDKYRLTETGEQIVRLYEAWSKLEKAAEWRSKLRAAAGDPPQTSRDGASQHK